MSNSVVVAGVGMIPFTKPGASEPYPLMAARAIRAALQDAGLNYDQVQQAYAGYVYGDSTAGQRGLYEVGMSGIPVINVNNNCSTGSTALYLARQAVESGAVDCALAFGFEQMTPGALGTVFEDRPSPFERFDAITDELVDAPGVPFALRYFGGAGKAGRAGLDTLLASRDVAPVTFRDWRRIEAAEVAAALDGRPREKFTSVEAMLAAIGR